MSYDGLLGPTEFYSRYSGRYFGKHKALVVDNNDPKMIGRVRVKCEPVYGESVSPWAYPCTFTGGAIEGGAIFVPQIGSYVWVEFEQGLAESPIWVGGFWERTSVGKPSDGSPLESSDGFQRNGSAIPIRAQGERDGFDVALKGVGAIPESNYDGKYPNVRMIKTPSGHMLEFDDTEGNERICIAHKSGAHIEIQPDGSIHIASSGKILTHCRGAKTSHDGDVSIETRGVTEHSTTAMSLSAKQGMVVSSKDYSQSASNYDLIGSRVSLNSSGPMTLSSDATLTAVCDGLSISATGNASLASLGTVNIDAGNATNVGNPLADALRLYGQNGLVSLIGADSTGALVKFGLEIMPTSSVAPPPATSPLPSVASIGPHLFLGNLSVPRTSVATPLVQEPMVMGTQVQLYLTAVSTALSSFFTAMSSGGSTPGFGGPNLPLGVACATAQTALATAQATFLTPSGAQANPLILSDIAYLSKT